MFKYSLKTRGRAASTRNHYVQLFHDLFRWAVKKGYLVRSPPSEDCDVRRVKVAKRRRRLVGDEEERLLGAARSCPRLFRLIIAALETAYRQGELLTLQWQDVNLDRKELRIRAENTKADEDRTLPISGRLASVLEMVEQIQLVKPSGHSRLSLETRLAEGFAVRREPGRMCLRRQA